MATGSIGDLPASLFSELLQGSMIDIYVGKARRHWSLHRNLLSHHSQLLEDELQGDGKKKPDTLELLDYDPAGFELFVKFLYQGRLDDVSDLPTPHQKYDYAVSCHQLYLLCERFDLPQLKNIAIDQYRKGLNQAELVPDPDEINDIYRRSPAGSPFRALMTRIAARQIMDPESLKDVGDYRECFEASPDFALDLVSAIKTGTGGVLFDDPTEVGNECEYHDHEAGPACYVKDKGKTQAVKATAPNRDPRSVNSAPSDNSVPRLRPHRPLRLISNPRPPPRQAHPQDGTSAGPLRRRLTSPAPSTVETSIANAMAMLPSPGEKRDKFRRVTPTQKHTPNRTSPQAGDRLPNSDVDPRQAPDSLPSDEGGQKSDVAQMESVSPRRNIWARFGSGGFGIINKIPHPEWKGTGILTSKGATSAVNGALNGGRLTESVDDFSVPSSTATAVDLVHEPLLIPTANGTLAPEHNLSNSDAEPDTFHAPNSTIDFPLFSQTRLSSDDLVASMTDTPSPRPPSATKSSATSSPLPPPKMKALNGVSQRENAVQSRGPGQEANAAREEWENAASPRRIPKYKIALASNLLSPARSVVT